MPKYQFRDGTPYDGPTIQLADGRVLSGASYTRDSQRLVEIEDGGERSRELHEASPEKKAIPKSKSGSKGRKSGPVVRKKSAKTRSTV